MDDTGRFGLCGFTSCDEESLDVYVSAPDDDGIAAVLPVCDWHRNVMLEASAN